MTTDRMVVLVAGPPGAGKSTYARELAARYGLRLLDRDDVEWKGEAAFHRAITQLGADPDARAVVVRACAARCTMEHTRDLVRATRVELRDLPAEECRARIAHDDSPGARARKRQRLAGVRDWWTRHAEDPWQPATVALGASRRWT